MRQGGDDEGALTCKDTQGGDMRGGEGCHACPFFPAAKSRPKAVFLETKQVNIGERLISNDQFFQ